MTERSTKQQAGERDLAALLVASPSASASLSRPTSPRQHNIAAHVRHWAKG